MKQFIRWGIILVFFLGATGAGFSLYAHFLVDYSLESLELALDSTDKEPATLSVLERNVHQSLVEDMAIEEASKEDADFQKMVMLEMASRSLGESLDRGGHARARVYLGQVLEAKKPERNPVLRVLDWCFQKSRQSQVFLYSFLQYLQRNLSKSSRTQEPLEFTSVYLLKQAQEAEQAGKPDEAAILYKKYLKLYPTKRERGFASIALAQLLIKQKRVREASKILNETRLVFAGSQESDLAARLIQKIDYLKRQSRSIRELRRLLAATDGSEADAISLKLALAHISVQEMEKAQEILKPLLQHKDSGIRQKAKFYMGWIYKLQSDYGESEKMLLALLEDPELKKELGLGLQAELADMYHLKGEPQKSVDAYENLLGKVRGVDADVEQKAMQEAWESLGELEQAKTYAFDLKNLEKAQEHLGRAPVNSVADSEKLSELLSTYGDISLKELGFQALGAKQVSLAFELLNRHLTYEPTDGATHSGLATIYVLFGNIEEAMDHAETGVDSGVDAYTAAVMGYVLSLVNREEEAIAFYKRSLSYDDTYLVSVYNLACLYLKQKDVESALEHFQRALELTEGKKTYIRVKSLNNAGYCYWILGRKQEARTAIEEAVQLQPEFQAAAENLKVIKALAVTGASEPPARAA